jgi:hypothetical protein
MTPARTSRASLYDLVALLGQVDTTTLEGLNGEELAAGHRMLMHLVGAGMDLFFDSDAWRPEFRRAHWAGRKFFGDNADCIYYMAQVDPALTYRIRGRLAGASYTSFTVDGGGIDEQFPPARVVSSLHDGQFEGVSADGDYELVASAEPQPGNWLRLEPDAGCIETRHYFERSEPVAADPMVQIPLTIEVVGEGPPPPPLEKAVARDIRRIATFVRGLTVDRPAPASGSVTVNQFALPAGRAPGGRYGAVDIVNMTCPYALEPGEALVIEGRYPPCRFASIALWNRWLQTLDYAHHQVSLNRGQTRFHDDGSFTVVVAERDPGVPNWIETTGVNRGTVYVRIILPEADPEPFATRVVPVADLRTNEAGDGG